MTHTDFEIGATRVAEERFTTELPMDASADEDAEGGGGDDAERGQVLCGDWVLVRFEGGGWCDVVSRIVFFDRDGAPVIHVGGVS